MSSFADSLILVLSALLRLFSLMLVTYALLSWFYRDFRHPVLHFLQSMVEPVLTPIRRVLPPIAGFDFSVVAALIAVELLRVLLLP